MWDMVASEQMKHVERTFILLSGIQWEVELYARPALSYISLSLVSVSGSWGLVWSAALHLVRTWRECSNLDEQA